MRINHSAGRSGPSDFPQLGFRVPFYRRSAPVFDAPELPKIKAHFFGATGNGAQVAVWQNDNFHHALCF
jgi:hypothetical protein